MKPHPFRVFVAIPAALLLGLAAVPQASALTPRGRLVEGAVIAVHPPTREASIRRQQTPQPLEYLFDAPRAELAIAIERVSAVGGTIETAHVRVYGRDAFVSGLVGRGPHRAALGAHIDVEVIAASGKIAQALSVNFLPSPIPSGRRGLSYSRYAARLQAIPPFGSSVRVTFHNEAPCARSRPLRAQ